MDIAEALPVEIVVEILTYLPCEDLISCTYVSAKWRELVNTNRIWLCLCMRENLHRKEYLDASKSLFTNPVKRFTSISIPKFSKLCHWRSHYDRYKFLQRNWRDGNCSLHRSSTEFFRCFYNDSTIVSVSNDKLVVYCVSGPLEQLFEHEFAFPGTTIEDVLVCKSHIVYIQVHHQCRSFVILKRIGREFIQTFQVSLKKNPPMTSINENLTPACLLRAEKLLVVVGNAGPHKIQIYNLETGKLTSTLDLEKIYDQKGLKVTCIKERMMVIYIAFTSETEHYIASYDLVEQKWIINYYVPYRVLNMYISRNYLCLKLKQWEPEVRSDFYVLSIPEMYDVDFFTFNTYLPVILTDDDYIFYSGPNYIFAKSLTGLDKSYKITTSNVMKFHLSWNNLVVVDTGECIEVWDVFRGEKLYTPFRGPHSTNISVDDRMIINFNGRYTRSLDILGFW